MTLSSFLAPQPPGYGHQPPFMHPPDMDRTDWSGGGWKGGKGNPKSALSALTLLAFLFFLSILQNCLKDTMGQTPTVMVMMVNLTRRNKRESRQDEPFIQESSLPACSEWTDKEISNMVHNQVQSHWNSESAFIKNNFKNRYKHINNLNNGSYIAQSISKIISEALSTDVLSDLKINKEMLLQDEINSPLDQRPGLKFAKGDVSDSKQSKSDRTPVNSN